ncbi:hypothetical protein JCM19039_1911 [Geomicrobium sp. JCM 19039]|nr:hypothetical protein JCM19039_1911 [Geomicrobium sp. JCM 19039]
MTIVRHVPSVLNVQKQKMGIIERSMTTSVGNNKKRIRNSSLPKKKPANSKANVKSM